MQTVSRLNSIVALLPNLSYKKPLMKIKGIVMMLL